ncbi:MAG: hypothetical protein AB1601_14250 [Planctomycetota bacterium]
MAFVDITSAQTTTFGTHSHGEEGFATPGGQYPAQLKWSDLHPPGVKVLPKGSAPAGAGEINWEDTLGGKFALALEKLEGLLYVVFGSRPGAFPRTGGYDKCQWYDRIHPRCLWGPEMWERRILVGPLGCNETGTCWDYQPTGKEYAALGENPPCCPMPKPQVPIRTRSGDPAGQFATGTHDRAYFPLGSVERDHQSGFPFDPEGFGWFGATQPGRVDSPAWLKTANGYTWKAGQAVKVYWTKPGSITTPTSVTLFYQLKGPGGAWGSWQSVAMALSGGKYQATLAAQRHGTECRWYIRYFWNDPDPQKPDVTKYEPGGDAAPAADEAYSFAWYTHFNPYAYGLPEMLSDYGGVDVRHGTDHFECDGGEGVQPALISMLRWVLSWLGGDCCTGEYDTCAETDDRCDAVHHNPRFRGGDDGLCCVPMPIKFRWSGSNQHPHYMTGGKAGGTDTQPLHNRAEDAGSQAARKTWRGINMLYADDEHFDNPFYGGGYSWGTAPGTFVLMYKPNHDPFAKVWAKYPEWGLRPGDVIEAVHIQEIVDAVDYLVDKGVWTTIPICTRKRTPGQYMGYDCGHHYAEGYTSGHGTYGSEYRKACDKCCANAEGCYPYDHALGYWYHQWGPGYDDSWTEYPDTCEAWPAPTWEECTQNCSSAKCHMMSRKKGFSHYDGVETTSCKRMWWRDTVCDGYDPLGQFGGEAAPGCGYHRTERGCYEWDWQSQGWVASPNKGYGCTRRVEGYSYYACTPDQCNHGWDDDHGGLFKKNRLDHVWHPGLYSKATGPPGNEFSGNCLGDMFGCGQIYPLGPDDGLWFHEVTGIYWRGLVPSWFDGCSGMPGCSSECSWSLEEVQALPPAIPGYGHHDEDGDPLCNVYYHAETGCFSSWQGAAACDGHVCRCSLGDFPACKGEAAWVAVDLNLDGSGRPYRSFPGREGGLPPYEGRGVPRLRNYDLTIDPATWMHDCPCETWTGAGTCVM